MLSGLNMKPTPIIPSAAKRPAASIARTPSSTHSVPSTRATTSSIASRTTSSSKSKSQPVAASVGGAGKPVVRAAEIEALRNELVQKDESIEGEV